MFFLSIFAMDKYNMHIIKTFCQLCLVESSAATYECGVLTSTISFFAVASSITIVQACLSTLDTILVVKCGPGS